jgi:hypothetical protein
MEEDAARRIHAYQKINRIDVISNIRHQQQILRADITSRHHTSITRRIVSHPWHPFQAIVAHGSQCEDISPARVWVERGGYVR